MTTEQFGKTNFGAGNTCSYMGEAHAIASINFKECLFGLIRPDEDLDDIFWVRCESIRDFQE